MTWMQTGQTRVKIFRLVERPRLEVFEVMGHFVRGGSAVISVLCRWHADNGCARRKHGTGHT